MAAKKGRQEQSRCDKYRENLSSAFRHFLNHAAIHECGGMRGNCSELLSQLKGAESSRNDWQLSIDGWEIPISDANSAICGVPGPAKLLLEGYVLTQEKGQVLKEQSISVSILLQASQDITDQKNRLYNAPTLRRGEWFVVRRIHFDYDISAGGRQHPRSHVQYGGNFRNKGNVGIRYELFEKPREPRIPYPPYDIVLCIDILLRQFITPVRDVINDPTWKNIVRESEKLWVLGYYEKLAEYLQKKEGDPLHVRQLSEIDGL